VAAVSILRAGPPSDHRLASALASVAGRPLTYGGVGCSLGRAPADGGLVDRSWSTVLLGPSDRFERAAEGLRRWQAHRGARLRVLADGPPATGQEVAVGIPLGPAHLVATCRVVAVIDHDLAFGFAYGTLPLHPERGEESFLVERAGHDVRVTVRAVSAAAHPLARAAGPLAPRLQAVAARRYLAALQRWVSR
jgi:uncharacterized protein (UPF0548 family)